MYGFRIIDGRLTAPGYDYQPGEGVHVCADLGDYNAVLATLYPAIDSGQVVSRPPEPGPFHLTQLQLETFLATHGLESAFLAALQSDPVAYHKYLISGDIASVHPLVNAFLPVIAGKMGLTADEAMDMLREAAQ